MQFYYEIIPWIEINVDKLHIRKYCVLRCTENAIFDWNIHTEYWVLLFSGLFRSLFIDGSSLHSNTGSQHGTSLPEKNDELRAPRVHGVSTNGRH